MRDVVRVAIKTVLLDIVDLVLQDVLVAAATTDVVVAVVGPVREHLLLAVLVPNRRVAGCPQVGGVVQRVIVLLRGVGRVMRLRRLEVLR